MKLNITPGPWRLCESSKMVGIHKVIRNSEDYGSWQIAFIAPDAWELKLDGQQESDANATAIVTAVNNTYHKGINPEAVPEMYNMLRLLYGSEELSVEESESILDILKKATL